jgi:hypothetical protein
MCGIRISKYRTNAPVFRKLRMTLISSLTQQTERAQMTAEEIRKRPISVENRLTGQTEWVTETYFLREIAAQLGELNTNRITLRDRIAGQVMAAIISSYTGERVWFEEKDVARRAYAMADAMLNERSELPHNRSRYGLLVEKQVNIV